MRYKDFIKLFLPPIIILLKGKIYPNKQPIRQVASSTIKQIKKNDDTLIVIGNGPSLNESIKKHFDDIKKHDSIVVNHFCETDLYTQIKPKYYLLADPAFFGDVDSYANWLKEKICRFIDAFVSKTTWYVNLIVPSSADGCFFVEKVKQNSFIHVYFYNSSSNVATVTKQEKFCAWDMNFLAPPAQTCINTCVWLGVFLRYKSIYMIGADTNWIELLHVDQKTNEVYTIDTHFYGKTKRTLYADVEGLVPQKLHDELNDISRALEIYWELEDYAQYAGAKVYNASEYSLIDAFERKNKIE